MVKNVILLKIRDWSIESTVRSFLAANQQLDLKFPKKRDIFLKFDKKYIFLCYERAIALVWVFVIIDLSKATMMFSLA
jgi:hypothetical protein